jgi:hypothetical protein
VSPVSDLSAPNLLSLYMDISREEVRRMDSPRPAAPIEPDTKTRDFYVAALKKLDEADIPYVVGGGYAMAYYTGIARNTKDLDIFVKPSDEKRVLAVMEQAGYLSLLDRQGALWRFVHRYSLQLRQWPLPGG